MEIAAADAPPTLWLALVIAKTALLAVAVGIFARVSWRLWPARLFALAAELPRHQARLRKAALALTAVVALAFVLGALADGIR